LGLISNHSGKFNEAGCDEAGRGCLAGPVFAAAVILPFGFYHRDLNDSKKISEKKRLALRAVIEKEAVSYSVAKMDAPAIDTLNILWASVKTMHLALDNLQVSPEYILVDGNKFLPYFDVSFDCIVGGDAKYASIAAASILAKTYRDEYMFELHDTFPYYHWDKNKGYPTETHRNAIAQYGISVYHRKTFRLLPDSYQLKIF